MEADLDHTITYSSIGSMAACHHDCHKLNILSLTQMHKKYNFLKNVTVRYVKKNQPPQTPYAQNNSLTKLNNYLFLDNSTNIQKKEMGKSVVHTWMVKLLVSG